jgi:pyruvate,water dikinase
MTEMQSNPSLKNFSTEFQDFLIKYGHRSHTREMFFPRWADDPSLVVDVLKALVSSPDLDVEALEKQKSEDRIATEKEVLERISKLKLGFFKKILSKTVLRYAQTYLMFRENQRFYLDHIIYRQRRLFTEYGRRFEERGITDRVDDIHFLSKEEIFKISRNELLVPKETIRQRREEFHTYADRLPPKFLKGNTEFDDTVVREANALKITGTGVSPGIATGLVRVVCTINELSGVREGEIMVTSNTDPGWTPVFPKLKGLITETGGILSHGAVVSREYNIPAVTAVTDATKILRTGQKVTIDGNDGVVTIMEG